MKLSEQAVTDLAEHMKNKCARAILDAASLTDDNSQRMFIATVAATLAFGMAAQFLQQSAVEKGQVFDWANCVGGLTAHVSKLALDNPPPDAEKLAASLAVPR